MRYNHRPAASFIYEVAKFWKLSEKQNRNLLSKVNFDILYFLFVFPGCQAPFSQRPEILPVAGTGKTLTEQIRISEERHKQPGLKHAHLGGIFKLKFLVDRFILRHITDN